MRLREGSEEEAKVLARMAANYWFKRMVAQRLRRNWRFVERSRTQTTVS